MMSRRAVLRPGDWVHYDSGEHQVVALAGTSVRLRSAGGAEMVVLASHLMSSPEFAVLNAEPLPALESFGLLDSLPADVLAAAKDWERHVVEVTTGLPPSPAPRAVPRPEYDPATRTLAQREQAKVAELAAAGRPAGIRTLQRFRARYAQQGLWGLVDQRAVRDWEATGRADARVVAAIGQALDAETNVSTGTRSRLIRRVVKALEKTYGPGVVPLPGKTTFYRLIEVSSAIRPARRHRLPTSMTRRASTTCRSLSWSTPRPSRR